MKIEKKIIQEPWLCLVLQIFGEKCKIKKIERKNRKKYKVKENKNRFKIDKLFLYTISNSSHLF